MKTEAMRAWIEALRSGEYEQTDGRLEQDGKYCCLGVLSDLAYKAGACDRITRHNHGDIMVSYGRDDETETMYLPAPVCKWAGLDTENPEVDIEMFDDVHGARVVTLVSLNDVYGYSFDQIADVIEKAIPADQEH